MINRTRRLALAAVVLSLFGSLSSISAPAMADDTNQAPVAANDTLPDKYYADATYVITKETLLANDTDAEGDTLSISQVATDSTFAKVSLNDDGNVKLHIYTMTGSQEVDFTYTLTDGTNTSEPATVSLWTKRVYMPRIWRVKDHPGKFFVKNYAVNERTLRIRWSPYFGEPWEGTLKIAPGATKTFRTKASSLYIECMLLPDHNLLGYKEIPHTGIKN